MRSTQARVLALFVLVVAACRSKDGGGSTPTPPPTVMVSFSGAVDASAGTVSIWTDSPGATGAQLALLQEIPVVQDGKPGTGPADTVELVTEGIQTIGDGCGAVDGYEAAIRLRSFYAGAVLTNAHVEITSMTPTGREACNSSAPYETLSDQFGLWDYGTLGRSGFGFNDALRSWRFRLPDTTRFVFRGRVVADLVTADPNPPTTVAVPGAGTYGAATSVELICSDAETGCAATYYTTDGTEPTASSPVYGGAISVASSFTLRFFSVDYWGNAEAVQSAAYVIDRTGPRVIAVSPAAGAVGVATTATVAVTFSEPVDPASVDATTFSVTGPAGAVEGAITASADHTAFTLTPAAPLQTGARYVVAVTSGVHDPAGNALDPEFTSDFYTPTPRQVIQPATSASLLNHQVVYDWSGNALAAWNANTTGGSAIVFATYSASTGTWSAAHVLATERHNSLWYPAYDSLWYPVRVASDGSQFLIVWCTTSNVRTVLVQNGAAGAISNLTTAGASLVQGDLTVSATATNRFLVARSYQWNVSGWRWNGSAWSAETTIGAGDTPVLSGSTVYYLGGDNASIMASTFGTAWSTPVAVAATQTGQGSPTSLSVGTSSGTVLAYGTTKGHVWAAVGSGTSFGTPRDLSGASSESSEPLAVAAGATGSEYAVAWITASGVARGAIQNGGVWPSTPATLVSTGATGLSVAGYSYGFLAALTVNDAGSSIASVWAVPTAGGYGSRTWASPIAVESGASMAREPAVVATGTSAMIHWEQTDAATDQVMLRPYTGTALGAAQTPFVPAAIAGSPADVKLAANGAGDVLAVWTQDDDGGSSVFAALHHAGTWSAPFRAVPRASDARVASNGTDFLILAWAASPTVSSANAIVAVPVSGGAAGPAEIVATGSVAYPRLASDGQGYAAAWNNQTTVQAAIRADGTWLPTRALGTGYVGTVAGRSGEYLFLWNDDYPRLWQQRASGSGAAWTWEAARVPMTYPYDVEAVGGPDGFFVASRNSGGTVEAWKVVGGVTGTVAPIDYGQEPCDKLRIAVSGSRYLVGLNCSDWLTTVETDGVTASAQVDQVSGFAGLQQAALGFGIAGGDDGRFRLVYSRIPSQFTPADVWARDSGGGTWGARTNIDDRSQSTQAAVAVQWDGGAYLAVWGQTTAASPIVDDLIAYWAF